MQLQFNVPESIVTPAEVLKELKSHMLDKALTKIQYYQSKTRLFEEKYHQSYDAFKDEVENHSESFEKYDDLILWEGYLLAIREWEVKQEAFLNV